MLNRRQISFVLILTFLFISACFGTELIKEKTKQFIKLFDTDPIEQDYIKVNDELALAWQHDIDLLHHLYKSQVIPDHLRTEQPVFTGAEFDLMQIFEFLDHLSMTPGYELAYSYFYQSSFEGHPTLYACESPFFGTPDSTNCQKGGLGYVVTDGSEQGYLQWLLLLEMGDQFYLYWHAAYKDRLLVSTEEGLEAILLEIDDSLNAKQKIQAQQIDPTPYFLFDEETVKIRAVWFTKFGGFFETYYRINKDHPHITYEIETNLLLEYDCDIMY